MSGEEIGHKGGVTRTVYLNVQGVKLPFKQFNLY